MSFDDLFREDRPNKILQLTPGRLVAAFTNLPNAFLLVDPDSGHGSLFQFHESFC